MGDAGAAASPSVLGVDVGERQLHLVFWGGDRLDLPVCRRVQEPVAAWVGAAMDAAIQRYRPDLVAVDTVPAGAASRTAQRVPVRIRARG